VRKCWQIEGTTPETKTKNQIQKMKLLKMQMPAPTLQRRAAGRHLLSLYQYADGTCKLERGIGGPSRYIDTLDAAVQIFTRTVTKWKLTITK
jgi:hypothetical protein